MVSQFLKGANRLRPGSSLFIPINLLRFNSHVASATTGSTALMSATERTDNGGLLPHC